MSDGIEFDRDLYRGTARHYDRFRVPYPQAMIEDLLAWVKPSGRGRLLDLACGTGQITFAIAPHFNEVWAVDQERDMVEVVRDKARATGAGHVRALIGRAEELDLPAGAFELVAIGNAFHRLMRDEVTAAAMCWLQGCGHIALLWASAPWSGDEDWQQALAALLASWRTQVGANARVPLDWDKARRERPDVEVLAAAGFSSVRRASFPTIHRWTVDELIGFVYSTSFLPRAVLGERAAQFERELQHELESHLVAGELRETIGFACELARRPA
jgi:SAM-dependent methyltransferase